MKLGNTFTNDELNLKVLMSIKEGMETESDSDIRKEESIQNDFRSIIRKTP